MAIRDAAFRNYLLLAHYSNKFQLNSSFPPPMVSSQHGAGFSIMPRNPKKKMCQTYKVLVLGDSGAGKTRFLHRMTSFESLSHDQNSQKDYLSKMAVVKNTQAPVKVQLWDTAGQEKFGAARLPSSFFRHADAAIVVYDVTDRLSFANVLRWVGQLQVYEGSKFSFSLFLVAHKSEISNSNRQVHEEEGRKLAKFVGAARFFECSSKTGTNIQKCFDAVAAAVVEGKSWPLSNVSLTRLSVQTDLGVSTATQTRDNSSIAARSPTLKTLSTKSKTPTVASPYIGTLAVLLSVPMVLLWLDDDAVLRWAEAMGLQ